MATTSITITEEEQRPSSSVSHEARVTTVKSRLYWNPPLTTPLFEGLDSLIGFLGFVSMYDCHLQEL